MIPFNKPYLTGKEITYIQEALQGKKLSGDGSFTKKCQDFFHDTLGFRKTLLTTSCTDALEMAAILVDIKPGDEVIVPSYTFVSTANAFALRGAKIVFADSLPDQPNIDPQEIARLITKRTKAIVVVHYAGVACDMDEIRKLAVAANIPVIEDAAQAIDSFYKDAPLGTLGDLAAFSFHETKNIICGEGGLISINNPEYDLRSEIIREKGTNRSSFFRGEVDKYGWVDVGSSFLPSDILAAFLFAQLEGIKEIQLQRQRVWSRYFRNLSGISNEKFIGLPAIPEYATNNAHMFYILCNGIDHRTRIIDALKANNILAVFHYQSLHSSPYFSSLHDGRKLVNSDRYTDCLLRLPLFPELLDSEVDKISELISTCVQ